MPCREKGERQKEKEDKRTEQEKDTPDPFSIINHLRENKGDKFFNCVRIQQNFHLSHFHHLLIRSHPHSIVRSIGLQSLFGAVSSPDVCKK